MTRNKNNSIKVSNHCESCKKPYEYILKMNTTEAETRWCVGCRTKYKNGLIIKENKEIKGFVKCEICGRNFDYKINKCKTSEFICGKCLKTNIKKPNGDFIKDNYYEWAYTTINSHKNKGHSVNIKIEDLILKAKSINRCPICKTPLTYRGISNIKSEYHLSATMDRIENKMEYDINGIDIICKKCNGFKGDNSIEELKILVNGFIKYIRKIDKTFKPKY